MNPEIKAKWLAKMESGEYARGTGSCHDPITNTFCALGVLGMVAVDAGVTQFYADKRYQAFGEVGSKGLLPTFILEWAGLTHDQHMTVADLNDSTDNWDRVIKFVKGL